MDVILFSNERKERRRRRSHGIHPKQFIGKDKEMGTKRKD